MKISTKARYAVRLVADIYKHEGDGTVPLKDVAKRQNLSKRYLSQLAPMLKNANLLKSVWGMNGGYNLARPASDITVLEVVEAVEGRINIIDCLGSEEICMRSEGCECKSLWKGVNEAIVHELENQTIADLAKNSGNGKKKSKGSGKSA